MNQVIGMHEAKSTLSQLVERPDYIFRMTEVTPFWRVIEAGSTIGKKLGIDSQRLTWLRESEQVS